MGNTIRIRYEDLSAASPAELGRILQSIVKRGGGEIRELGQPAFKKGLGAWIDYVENRDAVLAALNGDEKLRKYLP